MKRLLQILLSFLIVAPLSGSLVALAGSDPLARTESNCNFGMVKGEQSKSCHVPIPNQCTVAQYPGLAEPWAEVSKGGRTTCQFDRAQTDWKTTIVGTCQSCTTDQCSARFSVMFNCPTPTAPSNSQILRR